jgi:succinyl-diaminopimelate desuccinylase
MQQVYDVVTPVLGRRPETKAAPYVTDASALTPAYGAAPTVILGPGELGLAHQTDEWCSIERLEQSVEIYVELARRWCGL